MFFRFTNLFVFILSMSVLSMIGCGGANVPKDFPATIPFTITIANGGKPIEGVNIRLSTTMTTNWTVAGSTDASGAAVMQTISGSYAQKGVPEGSYKVIMTKPSEVDLSSLGPVPDMEDAVALAAYNAKAEELRSKMPQEVPSVYSQERTTPVTLEVAKGKSQETIDVGKH